MQARRFRHHRLPKSVRPDFGSRSSGRNYLPASNGSDFSAANDRLPTGDPMITAVIDARTQQLSMTFISAAILIVAKLEKVSEIAYGKMIWSLCRMAPQV
jgi:hypothetical protein